MLSSPFVPSQAVILVGGLGTRLGELTRETPKPLMDVAGKPFLEYLIWNLRRFGITRIVFASGYLANRIESHFGDGRSFGVTITYCRESDPLGTGGALRNCLPSLDEQFFMLNGDTLFDVNYFALLAAIQDKANFLDGIVGLRSVTDAHRFGLVTVDDERITKFAEKSSTGPGLINGGVYLLNRTVAESIPPDTKISLELDVFPKMVDRGRLYGIELTGYFLDIGLPETLQQAQHELPAWQSRPIAFLDRDGVINIDIGYLHRPADCQWVDGAFDAIRLLNESGYVVIVVTNQAGIARGYYSEDEFHEFMCWYNRSLAVQGAHLDDVFFCPFHPTKGTGKYQKVSDHRKPKPGMLFDAIKEWGDGKLDRSFMIGDKQKDMLAAEAAGIPGYLFERGNLLKTVESIVSFSL